MPGLVLANDSPATVEKQSKDRLNRFRKEIDNMTSAEEIQSMARNYEQVVDRLNKPTLSVFPTAEEARTYADDKELYDKAVVGYNEIKDIVREFNDSVQHFAKRKVEEMAGAFDHVPPQYTSKVLALAWEKGHAHGLSQYFDELVDLVDVFR